MDKELKSFISEIQKSTDVSFSIYSESGEFIAGEDFLKISLPIEEEIVSDKNADQTVFAFVYKAKKFIGCIKGSEKAHKNYAYLISELAKNVHVKESGLTKQEFFKAVVFGEISHAQIYKYLKKFNINDQASYVMILGASEDYAKDVINILSNSGDGKDVVLAVDSDQIVFVKFVDEDASEFQSPVEYAEFVKQMVYEETGTSIKIAIGGTVKAIQDINHSYNQANITYRMQNDLGVKGDVHSFKEFLLIKMLEDLPKYKLKESLDALMDAEAEEVFADEEMLVTAEEFLENSLNTSETSRKLYLHRNTLIYRLDKIERATGLNIRKFSDAVTFRLITILSRLVK